MRVVSLTASAAFLSLVFPQGTALANAPTGDQQIALTGMTTSSERPVQKITLTRLQGEPTRVAQAGLENVGIGNGHSLKRFSRTTLQSQGTSSFDPSDNAAILTEPISVNPFMVTGLSWSGQSALSANTQMFIRVRENAGGASGTSLIMMGEREKITLMVLKRAVVLILSLPREQTRFRFA